MADDSDHNRLLAVTKEWERLYNDAESARVFWMTRAEELLAENKRLRGALAEIVERGDLYGGNAGMTDAQVPERTVGLHPERTCDDCGMTHNPSWFVDSDRFNMAAYRGAIICPACFVVRHEEATGMHCSWELRPSTPFRWITDEGRITPFPQAQARKDAAMATEPGGPE